METTTFPSIDLRLGRWQTVLENVERVDAVICDPPYGVRTHSGWNDGEEQVRDTTGESTRTAIAYDALTPSMVCTFVEAWAPRCDGWMVAMTSHDLIESWTSAYESAGRYAFAPVVIIQKRPRLLGDGPASWAVYAMVSRPRNREFATWGCLPGAYESSTVKDHGGIAGTKPLELMRSIVRDYSHPGDLVCDPFCGSGTTALACAIDGRRFVGAEEKPEHHAIAMARLSKGHTPDMFAGF